MNFSATQQTNWYIYCLLYSLPSKAVTHFLKPSTLFSLPLTLWSATCVTTGPLADRKHPWVAGLMLNDSCIRTQDALLLTPKDHPEMGEDVGCRCKQSAMDVSGCLYEFSYLHILASCCGEGLRHWWTGCLQQLFWSIPSSTASSMLGSSAWCCVSSPSLLLDQLR